MERIYSFELYNKRTNKDLLSFFKDYLGFKDEYDSSNLDKELDHTKEFVEMVNKHINDKIVIIGDYDVDGISATTIMYKGLKKYKALNISYMIPNRFLDGYGMNKRLVDEAIKMDAKLIITVDNGIKAFESILYAKEHGIDVVVTDHHLPDDSLPQADVVINSHIENKSLDTKDICGAMISYLLIKKLLNKTDFDLKEELILAQIATISDVMPLIYENRTIVKIATKIIKEELTTYNKGLDSLFNSLKVNYSEYNNDVIAFKIAPVLNTPGRLNDASLSVELLINDNQLDSRLNELISLNNTRKEKLKEAKEEAIKLVSKEDEANVIYLENALEGVVGIVAGSLLEDTQKPTFIFTKGEEGLIKGSGRSPKWCDLSVVTKDILDTVKPYSFGGHANAMGLSFNSLDDLNKFRELLNQKLKTIEKEEELTTFLRYPEGYEIEEVKDTLDILYPFGEGLKEPVFVYSGNDFLVYPLGKGHTKIKFFLGGKETEGLYFFHQFNKESFKNYNIYFKLHKEYSSYSRRIEYKAFIENIVEINK